MKSFTAVLLSVAILNSVPTIWAQRYAREWRHAHAESHRTEENPCYNPSDARQLPLWSTNAPGSVGNDPCRDIPYLQIFQTEVSSRRLHPAILIIPGGGYDKLTDKREQAPVAEYFASQLGVTAFVLRYRLVQPDGTYRFPVPMWDGQRAIRAIRAHAREYGVDPNRIALFGFSAGGHLASTLALHPEDRFGAPVQDGIDQVSAQVDLLGLGYPVISMDPSSVPPSGSYRNLLTGFGGSELARLQNFLSGEKNVTAHTPSTFLFESLDDQKISPLNSQLFASALKRAGVSNEIHIFNHGEHGSGLSIGVPEEDAWPSMFQAWIATQWPDLTRRLR